MNQSELFVESEKEQASRWIIMNDMDVRMCLATGVVPLPEETRLFAPGFNSLDEGWRWIDINVPLEPVAVQNDRRACLVHMPGVRLDGEFLGERVPASMIESIGFPNALLGDDWIARSAGLEGLPSKLPNAQVVDNVEYIVLDAETASAKWSRPAVIPTEQDRVAGVLTVLLAAGEIRPSAMQRLCETRMVERPLILDLINEPEVAGTDAINLCLDILGDTRWYGGFDPCELLDEFKIKLTEVIEEDIVHKWCDYVGKLLRNLCDEKENSLLDDKSILLRALQLVLRTAPLSVREIDSQIAVRKDSVGPRVARLARAFASWYEGFGALAGDSKKRPELYSIGSRVVVGSDQYPLNFSITQQSDQEALRTTTLLLESDHKISSHTHDECTEYKEAYYRTRAACEDMEWNLSYDPELRRMRISIGTRLIFAELIEQNHKIHWWASTRLPSSRKWTKSYYEKMLSAASQIQCNFSIPKGNYPDVVFNSYQLLTTMDREEIPYHINAILQAMDVYEGL